MKKKVISATNDPLEYPWNRPNSAGIMKSNAEITLDSIDDLILEIYADNRFLVIDIGSNSCLDVMRNKFRQRGAKNDMTMLYAPAIISNIQVTHMANIAPRGYIPATVIDMPGNSEHLWAAWLDREQMAALDSTEPGYKCKYLDAKTYPITITSLDKKVKWRPDGFYIYEGECGSIMIDQEPQPLVKQAEVFQVLANQPPLKYLFDGTPREIVERFSDDNRLCTKFQQLLKQNGLIYSANLKGEEEARVEQRRMCRVAF